MSKLIITLIFVVLFLASCTVNKGIVGNYYKKGKDFTYNITLNKDSTFTLMHQSYEANSKCQGKWHYITKEEILLKCNSGSLMDAISMGDLSDREFKVTIIKGNKLKIQNAILIRSN